MVVFAAAGSFADNVEMMNGSIDVPDGSMLTIAVGVAGWMD